VVQNLPAHVLVCELRKPAGSRRLGNWSHIDTAGVAGAATCSGCS
jgi:hypothetical protein